MPRNPLTQRGFTLIELMVVIVILGIVASFAALSVGSRDANEALAEEVARFASLLELASEEAVISGRQFGVRLTPEGYEFLVYQDQKWTSAEEDEVLRPRLLPAALDVELRLYLDGLPVSLDTAQEESREDEDGAARPQLLLLSSGEQTPAELVFAPRFEPDVRFRLRLPPLGRPQWERIDDGVTG